MKLNLPDFLHEHLQDQLAQRQKQQNLRKLPLFSPNMVDFSSNDYLGLATNRELTQAIDFAYKNLSPAKNGATGSRLISGNSTYVESVEKDLATIFQGESALLFSSGYMANQAVLSALPGKNDVILYDELAHACIKDGARLSLATRYPFRHNDLSDLTRKIESNQQAEFIYIVVESVYSMDGDQAFLEDLIDLKKRFLKVCLLIDEAHSTGIYGAKGAGLTVEKGLHSAFTARVYTFGKAMGIHGACVVGSEVLKQFLINFSRPFIYTTAPDDHSVAAVQQAFRFLQEHPNLAKDLFDRIHFFQEKKAALDWGKFSWTDSDSPIQSLIIPGNETVKKIAQKMQEQGFFVRGITSPTVKAGQERLRICLHNFNSESEIEQLLQHLHQVIHSENETGHH
ncbi:8-amino-7-oxononanoate synthase [Cytophagales bacterium LB-30]|uniref:8-amino-7-oxononanoate synthase n=1 Tax=Shiella aurantiaca TaxID=3058365 RepID=A0ABT8F4P4_9BACT|nr:8-amino-7-oxononanoate synthase [Shiella aurantiaca]MDN4165432.1 8-amino-7-oxononanoate synthase [Shiella aurantiaca]